MLGLLGVGLTVSDYLGILLNYCRLIWICSWPGCL